MGFELHGEAAIAWHLYFISRCGCGSPAPTGRNGASHSPRPALAVTVQCGSHRLTARPAGRLRFRVIDGMRRLLPSAGARPKTRDAQGILRARVIQHGRRGHNLQLVVASAALGANSESARTDSPTVTTTVTGKREAWISGGRQCERDRTHLMIHVVQYTEHSMVRSVETAQLLI